MYASHTIKLTSAGKKFFQTRKNSMIVIELGEGSSVELNSGYWDGGSRSSYSGWTKNGNAVTLSYPSAPPQFGGGEAPKVPLREDFGVMRGGVFRGKDAHLTLYVTKLEGWLNPLHGVVEAKR
jgi:hypothetical protein